VAASSQPAASRSLQWRGAHTVERQIKRQNESGVTIEHLKQQQQQQLKLKRQQKWPKVRAPKAAMMKLE